MKVLALWSVNWGVTQTKTTLIAAETFDQAVKMTVEYMTQERPDAGMTVNHINSIKNTEQFVLVA